MRHPTLLPLLRGLGLMGTSELVNRASRLVTAVVLARCLGIEEFALLSVVLTTYELVRILTYNGFGARIVQAQEDELGAVCSTVGRMNWALGLGLAILHLLLAWPLGKLYGSSEIAWMTVALAGVYLVYPASMVQVFLAQRQNRLGLTATMSAVQVSMDNLLSAGLALSGFGPWSAVLPKLVVAPVWVLIFRWRVPVLPHGRPSRAKAREILAYSRCVLGAETLNTLRQHVDKLVIGKVLGLTALGYYAFAVSAGVGITTSVVGAFGTAVLPFLCGGRDDRAEMRRRFRLALGIMIAVTVPVILLQSALAPLYVPIVFGARWIPAIPVLVILCLSALARPIMTPVTMALRATGAVDSELRQATVSAILFALGLCAGLPFGIEGVAVGVLAAALLPVPFFVVAALRRLGAEVRPATGPRAVEAFA